MDDMILIPENMVGVGTAARMIGVSTAWVRRECRVNGFGKLVDGRYLIPPSCVEKLRALKRKPGRPAEKRKNSEVGNQ
jgi:peptide deformylase